MTMQIAEGRANVAVTVAGTTAEPSGALPFGEGRIMTVNTAVLTHSALPPKGNTKITCRS
jgi:hypothetical protein